MNVPKFMDYNEYKQIYLDLSILYLLLESFREQRASVLSLPPPQQRRRIITQFHSAEKEETKELIGGGLLPQQTAPWLGFKLGHSQREASYEEYRDRGNKENDE
ncbi:hypothetical protein JTE90_019252 [Oedothorax gibbosus]|uniref:Uncharacterized protein n=1 Tax=Oedothorax gibbosus TaxID=931172 RepID=A0AAV6URG1_9ARAC|nr:hypothetical protein JTE90_019252 [Oedothorax gibbosus]